MPSELSSAKRAEIKSKSVIGLPNTVTGKPDIVKNAIYDPVDMVATEVNRIVGETNDELTKCNDKITENKTLIEKNITDISNIFSKLIDKIFPIGRYYISDEATSPAKLFGGSWEQLTADAYLKIVTSDAGKTGGTSSTHKIPTESMPSHTHLMYNMQRKGAIPLDGAYNHVWRADAGESTATTETGGGKPYYPYYCGVYVWRRRP